MGIHAEPRFLRALMSLKCKMLPGYERFEVGMISEALLITYCIFSVSDPMMPSDAFGNLMTAGSHVVVITSSVIAVLWHSGALVSALRGDEHSMERASFNEAWRQCLQGMAASELTCCIIMAGSTLIYWYAVIASGQLAFPARENEPPSTH